MRRFSRTVLLAIAVATSACARSSPPRSSAPRAAASQGPVSFPLTVEAANGGVIIARRPARILSLSPTATEMLFAIGAGTHVVAVDNDSTYPPSAPRTRLSGLQPNVEAIARFAPDLVIISNDVNRLVKSLDTVGIPVLLEPAAGVLADTYAQMEQLGRATGHASGAARVVASMKDTIRSLVASAPSIAQPLTYYHELDQTYYTVTSATFIGHLYGLLGLRNIADEAKGASSGYPQLSAEYLIHADPDVIFLGDTRCCGQSARSVSRRPGWDQITAVREGAVVPLDDDVASRWGPRVVDLLRTIVHAVTRVAPKLEPASP